MMKSILLPILILVTSSTFAQNHFIGIKGGISWSNASKTGYANDWYYNFMEKRRGFTFGLSYENRLKQHFIVSADIMYQQRGYQIQKDFKLYYDYLAIPIKGGYIIGNKISGFANIGLVPSFLLKAKAKIPDEVEIIDVTDLHPKFDLAALVEIGGNVKISERLFVTASFSYQHSFTTHSNSDNFGDIDARHHALILSVGIKYALKKN